jgi:hypothetical protein
MPSQHTWPFDQGQCTVTAEVIICRRGGSEWRHARSDGPVHVTRYRLFPFLVRTIVWIANGPSHRGFVTFRAGQLLNSLAEHGWPLNVRTVSWTSWVSESPPA